MRLIGIFCFVICTLWSSVEAQNDNVMWSGIRLRDNLSKNWSLQVQPFFRFNQDLGAYQNSSIDLSIRKNLSKKWYVQFLSRTWFLPDGFKDQQFLWWDVGFKSRLESFNLNLNQNLRLHYAIIDETQLSKDFIRYKISFVPNNNWKFKPTFAFEPWWQLNGVNDFERYRIEPGFNYRFSDNISLIAIWRRQNHLLPTPFYQNLWTVILFYDFK